MRTLSSDPAGIVDEIYYPSSDGKPMAETEIHVMLILNTLAALRHFFRQRHDVYVAGNMFLYYRQGNPKKRRTPDIMVVKGVDATVKRRSFKIWEEKQTPRTVLEFTSAKTAAEDLGPKKRLYEALKVREYFLFDPLHDYLPQGLMGFRLVGGAYEPMVPKADGSLLSAELGLRLAPQGTDLGLYDAKTGEELLPMAEALKRLEETKKRINRAEKRASEAERRLQKEKRKAAELQAELKRLRRARKRKEP